LTIPHEQFPDRYTPDWTDPQHNIATILSEGSQFLFDEFIQGWQSQFKAEGLGDLGSVADVYGVHDSLGETKKSSEQSGFSNGSEPIDETGINLKMDGFDNYRFDGE